MPVLSKEFLDIQATMECVFTLKHVHDMTRTNIQSKKNKLILIYFIFSQRKQILQTVFNFFYLKKPCKVRLDLHQSQHQRTNDQRTSVQFNYPVIFFPRRTKSSSTIRYFTFKISCISISIRFLIFVLSSSFVNMPALFSWLHFENKECICWGVIYILFNFHLLL